MNISFILVEPAVPSNIGASARAIKTMGFTDLFLINPCDYKNNEATWLAHGSNDILDNAIVYNSFINCISQFDYIIGTSAKQRTSKFDYYPIEVVNDVIINKGNTIKNIGIVFGKEESGLTNDEIKQCDIISYIPMAHNYPSLNLSQAVMLYAYQLSKLSSIEPENEETYQDGSIYQALKNNIKKVLDTTPIPKNENLYHRILERIAGAGKEDIHLINSVCNAIIKAE